MTTIELDEQVAEKLRKLAERQNRSLNEFLTVIADEYVDEPPQKMTRAEARKALIGYIKADIPDGSDRVKEATYQHVDEKLGETPANNEALEAFFGMLDTDITDLSTTVNETLEEYYRSRYVDPD